jgi:hypothetical protein
MIANKVISPSGTSGTSGTRGTLAREDVNIFLATANKVFGVQ